MGYSTRFTGALDIEPPLNWHEIRQCELWAGHDNFERNGARLKLDEQVVDSPGGEGVLIRRTAPQVVIEGDDLRSDEVLTQLRGLAKQFGEYHDFNGRFEAYDDHPDSATPWRIRIFGTGIVEEHPVLLWPLDEKAVTIVATTLGRMEGLSAPIAEPLAKGILRDLRDGLKRRN
jgi:hypothetical protein